MHKVKLQSIKTRDDDNLCAIFAARINQSIGFLHEWLRMFMLMHRKHFTTKHEKYLKLKGLTIEIWADSIINSQKGK